jgi:hypothetical protein
MLERRQVLFTAILVLIWYPPMYRRILNLFIILKHLADSVLGPHVRRQVNLLRGGVAAAAAGEPTSQVLALNMAAHVAQVARVHGRAEQAAVYLPLLPVHPPHILVALLHMELKSVNIHR